MKFAKKTDQIVWEHLPQIVENEPEKMGYELGFLAPKMKILLDVRGRDNCLTWRCQDDLRKHFRWQVREENIAKKER